MKTILACLMLAALCRPTWAESLYVGSGEHHEPDVHLVLTPSDIMPWGARSGSVDAYCFFHAANIAHVDGHWFAINGISRTGLGRHWIEDDGARAPLEDEDKAAPKLRTFLSDLNNRMNAACP